VVRATAPARHRIAAVHKACRTAPRMLPGHLRLAALQLAVVYITVATIVVIVQAGQFLGNWPARRALRR